MYTEGRATQPLTSLWKGMSASLSDAGMAAKRAETSDADAKSASGSLPGQSTSNSTIHQPLAQHRAICWPSRWELGCCRPSGMQAAQPGISVCMTCTPCSSTLVAAAGGCHT